MKNMLIITNILTPYRKFFFDLLHKEAVQNEINLQICVMAEKEPNRNWAYDNLKTSYTKLLSSKTISVGKMCYIHYNPDIEKYIQKYQPKIIIAGGSYICPTIWKVISMKKRYNFKLVFWSESHLSHGKNENRLVYFSKEVIRQIIYKKFDEFWCPGKLSNEFVEKYASNRKIIYAPNLVDSSEFKRAIAFKEQEKNKIKEKFNVGPNKYIFFIPARLSYEKGIDKFIEIYIQSKKTLDAVLLIAGEGEQKDELTKIIKRAEGFDIRLLGNKNQKEIVELYAISDCFCLPSLSDANPLTCIEALWAGATFLVSENVGNHPEVIKDGVNGSVFSYSDIEGTIQKIERLIGLTEEERLLSSKRSLQIAEELYSPDKNVKRLIKETFIDV